jgi:hypothetical protein
MVTHLLVHVPTSRCPVLALVPKWDECQFGISGMKPGSGTRRPVSKLGEWQNHVTPSSCTGPSSSSTACPKLAWCWFGYWVFQFRNWMPSSQIGTVPKWGWTYIQGLLFHLYLGIVPTCKVYIDYINHQVRQMLNSSCPPEWLEAKTGLFLK